MRVKRSVDFRMAPKKSSKGKGAAAEPTREEGCVASKCSESDLEILDSSGLLLEKSIIQWRPAFGEDRPYENTSEIIVSAPYLEQGFSFPCLFFFWAPALLQDPASSLDPQLPCTHFYLRAFMRNFFGHRAPF